MVVQDRLATKERLSKHNQIQDTMCILCNATVENRQHLFFECPYSKQCLRKVQEWLNWKYLGGDLLGLIRNIQRSRVHQGKKKCYASGIAALIYGIWMSRNKGFWEQKVMLIEEVVQQVKQGVKRRLLVLGYKTGEKEYAERLLTSH